MSSRGSPEPGKGHINISTSLPTTYRWENKPKMPYSRNNSKMASNGKNIDSYTCFHKCKLRILRRLSLDGNLIGW